MKAANPTYPAPTEPQQPWRGKCLRCGVEMTDFDKDKLTEKIAAHEQDHLEHFKQLDESKKHR